MKKSRFTEAQIMAVLRQAEGGLAVPAVPRARDQQRDVLQVARPVWRHGCVHDEPDEGAGGREPAAEAHVRRPEHAGGSAQRGSWKKVTRPAQRRELAEKAVATKGVSIALACRAFGVSETCFRYIPKRDEENEMMADLRSSTAKCWIWLASLAPPTSFQWVE